MFIKVIGSEIKNKVTAYLLGTLKIQSINLSRAITSTIYSKAAELLSTRTVLATNNERRKLD
jgi:hypothetical protein